MLGELIFLMTRGCKDLLLPKCVVLSVKRNAAAFPAVQAFRHQVGSWLIVIALRSQTSGIAATAAGRLRG
jgi:hypothetical protein